MVCFHCGRDDEAKSKVCRSCGYPLISEEADIGFSRPDTEYIGPKVENLHREESPDQKMGNRSSAEKKIAAQQSSRKEVIVELEHHWKDKKLLAAIFSIAVILMTVAIFYGIGQRNVTAFSYLSEDALEIFADTNKNTTFVWNTDGRKLFKMDGVFNSIFTPDKTAAILFDQENQCRYYVNAGKLIRLREDIGMLCMSANGKYLMYYAADEQENILYRYDIKKGKEELLDRGKRFGLFITSPDGKTMAYVATSNQTGAEREDFACYLIQDGGEPEFFGRKRAIFALSNHAEYTYYYELQEKNEIAAYVKKDGQSIYLTNSLNGIMVNIDCSELLYSLEGSTYLCSKGEDKIKLYDSLIRDVIRPKNGLRHDAYMSFNSFKNKALIFQDNAVVWVDDKFAARKIGNNVGHYFAILSDTENTLMYGTRKLEIEKVTIQGETEDSKRFVNHADQVATSGDLSKVYYLSGNQLYYKKNMAEAIMLAEDAEGLCLNAKGDIAFFQRNCIGRSNMRIGKLYYVSHGGEPKPVKDGGEAAWLGQWNYGIVFAKENDKGSYDLYYNTEGIKFKRILEEVSYEDIINSEKNY